MDLGKKLFELRKSKNLSQEDVAEKFDRMGSNKNCKTLYVYSKIIFMLKGVEEDEEIE